MVAPVVFYELNNDGEDWSGVDPFRFLPPCGLDVNLVEKVFSRLKIVRLRIKMNESCARA